MKVDEFIKNISENPAKYFPRNLDFECYIEKGFDAVFEVEGYITKILSGKDKGKKIINVVIITEDNCEISITKKYNKKENK